MAKICIYGAGAIGGYLAACLDRAGAEVSLVARGPHLAAIQKNGLRLNKDGEVSVHPLQASDDPRELGEQDYIILALKAHGRPRDSSSISREWLALVVFPSGKYRHNAG